MTDFSQERFWLVWRPGGTNPRYRHSSKKSAEAEAARRYWHDPTDVNKVAARAAAGDAARAVRQIALDALKEAILAGPNSSLVYSEIGPRVDAVRDRLPVAAA